MDNAVFRKDEDVVEFLQKLKDMIPEGIEYRPIHIKPRDAVRDAYDEGFKLGELLKSLFDEGLI